MLNNYWSIRLVLFPIRNPFHFFIAVKGSLVLQGLCLPLNKKPKMGLRSGCFPKESFQCSLGLVLPLEMMG